MGIPQVLGQQGSTCPLAGCLLWPQHGNICVFHGIPMVEFGNPYECCERGGAKITLKLILRNMVQDQLRRYRQRLKHLNKDMPKWAKMMLSKHDLVVFLGFGLAINAKSGSPNADRPKWPLHHGSWRSTSHGCTTTHTDIDIISILYPVYDILCKPCMIIYVYRLL